MELSITLQLVQACAAILTGTALGVFYDILKTLRLRLHVWPVTAVLDLVFWLVAAFALFALGLGPGRGQLRLFMLICTLGGALLYSVSFSPVILAVLGYAADFIGIILEYVVKPFEWLGKQIKKTKKIYKNLFQKCAKWFRISSNSKRKIPARGRTHRGEDAGGETKAGRYYY
ncbi:MAG: spore cortex biosynthesis protein YabQ [Oscillospiraceae bacterium]|jgi:hypothetical protein